MTQVQVRTQSNDAFFEIHEEGAPQELHLQAAFLLYSTKDQQKVYASSHPVIYAPGAPDVPLLGPGSAPSKKALATLGATIVTATGFTGFIPESLLYIAPGKMVWWCPPQDRHLWFKSQDERIGEAHATISQPGLVFMAAQGELYVWALAEAGRPTPETPLFKAPYFNVWSGGRVCVGNANFPTNIDAAAIAAYEKAFFGSYFTHPNDQQLVSYPGGSTEMWAQMLADPTAEWVWNWQGVLVPYDTTLAVYIKDSKK